MLKNLIFSLFLIIVMSCSALNASNDSSAVDAHIVKEKKDNKTAKRLFSTQIPKLDLSQCVHSDGQENDFTSSSLMSSELVSAECEISSSSEQESPKDHHRSSGLQRASIMIKKKGKDFLKKAKDKFSSSPAEGKKDPVSSTPLTNHNPEGKAPDLSPRITDKSVNLLTNWSELSEKYIYDARLLPLAEPKDLDHYKPVFPTKVVPIVFSSKNVYPAVMAPLDYIAVFHHYSLLKDIQIHAFVTLPKGFCLHSQQSYPLVTILHTSAGLTPQEYILARQLNDADKIVCIIDYAHPARLGVKGKAIADQTLFNPLMPAIDAYRCAQFFMKNKVNKNTTIQYIRDHYTLIGLSLGGTAALRAANKHFRQLFFPYVRPYRLFLVAGALPACQLASKEERTDEGMLVVAFHGTKDSYCAPEPMINFVRSAKMDCQLRLIQDADHGFWFESLENYCASPLHRSEHVKQLAPQFLINHEKIYKIRFEIDVNEARVIYHRLPAISEATFMLNAIQEYKQKIDAETLRLLSVVLMPDPRVISSTELQDATSQLIHRLKDKPLTPRIRFDDVNPEEPDAQGKILHKVFESFKVIWLGHQSPRRGQAASIKHIQDSLMKGLSSKDMVIEPWPAAAAYMFDQMLQLINDFGGKEWDVYLFEKAQRLTRKKIQEIHLGQRLYRATITPPDTSPEESITQRSGYQHMAISATASRTNRPEVTTLSLDPSLTANTSASIALQDRYSISSSHHKGNGSTDGDCPFFDLPKG
jgi:hypothetical protein